MPPGLHNSYANGNKIVSEAFEQLYFIEIFEASSTKVSINLIVHFIHSDNGKSVTDLQNVQVIYPN